MRYTSMNRGRLELAGKRVSARCVYNLGADIPVFEAAP
jgi:hypothetical protein